MRLRDRLPLYAETIPPSNFVTESDYIIYKSGSNTKALNGATGVVDYSDAHADVPFNLAIAAASNGVRFFVKPATTYTLYDTIVSGRKCVQILGAGWGRSSNPQNYPLVQFRPLNTLGAKYLIKFGDGTGDCWNCQIKNIGFYGREQTDNLGAILFDGQRSGCLEDIFISNFYNEVTPAIGIDFTSSDTYNNWGNDLRNIHIWNTPIGMRFDNLANCNSIYSGLIQNGVHANAKGVYIQGCDSLQFYNMDFESFDEAGSIALHIETGIINRFIGTRFENNRVNVQIDAGAGTNYFTNCSLGDATVTNVIDNGTTKSRFTDCSNYKTRNKGTSTGTGAQQTIAHGLKAAPNNVFITPTASGVTEASITAASDITNIYPTVTNLKTYQWYAEYLA